MKPGYLPKKYCGPPVEEVDIEFVELDDTLKYWCSRIQGWRFGRVEKIGPKFFHVVTNHKLRKVPRNDERLYLKRDNENLLIVGGDK